MDRPAPQARAAESGGSSPWPLRSPWLPFLEASAPGTAVKNALEEPAIARDGVGGIATPQGLSYHRPVEHHNSLAILVGGGPAPGINSVIGAATIRARLEGMNVIGLRDGFEWIMHGDIDHVTPLTIEAVSRIHFRGGTP